MRAASFARESLSRGKGGSAPRPRPKLPGLWWVFFLVKSGLQSFCKSADFFFFSLFFSSFFF